MVIDDDDRDFVAQLVEGLEQLFHDSRGQTLEWLVQQQDAGIAGQGTGHGHHLLFAAGQIVGRG